MDNKKPSTANEYTEAFRRKVCEEYLATGVSKMYLLSKYNIRYKSAIQKWMRLYNYEDIHIKTRYLPLVAIPSLTNIGNLNHTSSASDQRIKELEQLLEDEKLRSEAYLRMIAIAEKEFNVQIRKKPNTK